MTRVWRYDMVHGGTIQIPAGARLLSCQWFDGGVKLWAMCEADVPKVTRKIHMISTGHDVHETWDYAGTVLHGEDVWHVFLE